MHALIGQESCQTYVLYCTGKHMVPDMVVLHGK